MIKADPKVTNKSLVNPGIDMLELSLKSQQSLTITYMKRTQNDPGSLNLCGSVQ